MLGIVELEDVEKKRVGDEIESMIVLTDSHIKLIESRGITLEILVSDNGQKTLHDAVSYYDYTNILTPGMLILEHLYMVNFLDGYFYDIKYTLDANSENKKRIENELRAGEHFLSTTDTTMINDLPYEFKIIDRVIVMVIGKGFKDIIPTLQTLSVKSKICRDILSYVLCNVEEDKVLRSKLYLRLIENIKNK